MDNTPPEEMVAADLSSLRAKAGAGGTHNSSNHQDEEHEKPTGTAYLAVVREQTQSVTTTTPPCQNNEERRAARAPQAAMEEEAALQPGSQQSGWLSFFPKEKQGKSYGNLDDDKSSAEKQVAADSSMPGNHNQNADQTTTSSANIPLSAVMPVAQFENPQSSARLSYFPKKSSSNRSCTSSLAPMIMGKAANNSQLEDSDQLTMPAMNSSLNLIASHPSSLNQRVPQQQQHQQPALPGAYRYRNAPGESIMQHTEMLDYGLFHAPNSGASLPTLTQSNLPAVDSNSQERQSTHHSSGNEGHAVATEQVPVNANLVEESEVVMAEPLTLPIGDNDEDDTGMYTGTPNNEGQDQAKKDQLRAWVGLAGLFIVVAGVIVLAIVLTADSNADPEVDPISSTGSTQMDIPTTTSNSSESNNLDGDTVIPTIGETSSPSTALAGTEAINDMGIEMSFLPDFTREVIALDGLKVSGQSLAWQWLQQHPEFDSMPSWRKLQLMALASLYYSTRGDTWVVPPFATTWLNTSLHECDWQGRFTEGLLPAYQFWALIENNCTDDGVYLNLTLQETGLRGTLPPEISFLTRLTALDLNENFITGQLPSQIGELTLLEVLKLENNLLRGSLPDELFGLSGLTKLHLGTNAFTGALSNEVTAMTSLTDLSIFMNQLTGTLTSGINALSELTSLSVRGNLFSGTVPSGVFELTELESLVLDNNQFSGTFPTEVGVLTKLKLLHIMLSQFTGPLPTELGLLTSLSFLHFQANHFNSTLPSELNALSKMMQIDFGRNDLTGTLPDLSRLTAMTSFNGRDNRQGGTIPDLSSMTDLQWLWLQNNAYTGSLPWGLSKMTSLLDLRLSFNQLTGRLFPTLTSLSRLRQLHLQNNSFSDTVPSSVCDSVVLLRMFVDCDLVNCSCTVCGCMEEDEG
ncbi:Leucine rich repeat N-terminal domain [Seminavis robusta]|uniref:Leucine rich repeat N-terminal domain n=1 Tax=Seminavis robusta TaxID=568900 RepID=A0A9N8EZ17_9STRA|nr:Leucine rich repeat N-terminal domain [Seminavis robusta]|eukprot:Sro2256_g321040.1 Leucine rich repeat N-terminal domain (916) ;mRNA; r:6590-9424